MVISNAIIKHYLRNVMFINGTSYAGKSTMVRMLADEFDLIHCGENYDCIPPGIVIPEQYPHLGYFQTKTSWQEFYSRSPEAYDDWVQGCTQELIEFEITYLMSIAQNQKVIVDTNLPVEVLREIADYHQVAIMVAPASMAIENFFNRNDDKPSILEEIRKMDDPEKGLANYQAIIERICRQEKVDAMSNVGFFTLTRKDTTSDTKAETMHILAKHFGLIE